MAGPYIARRVASFKGQSVGIGHFKGQCAALVQWLGGAPKASAWRAGDLVKGADIATLTCIATFEDGVYPNRKHGNHAAVYIEQDATGIHVWDQWSGKPISRRWIPFAADGDLSDPSNNGNCFHVIA